jgi:nucleoid DNA-binding protein
MAKKTTTKTTTKTTATKAKKISPAGKPRTKGEFYSTIATNTDLSRKQVVSVFDMMSKMMAADLGRSGPGVCNIAGMMKVIVKKKPATPSRRGVNPFTGQEMTFKAKPAKNVIKIRPMKALKAMV